ncbi:MAG: response regulator [Dehalococcoidia bacterium]|nr:response regulator [Dehalococcoidia bacterium]
MNESDRSELATPLRKVLVVDDEDTVRTALQASIETFDGFDVDTAEDGEIGLAMIAGERYDVVLVDLMMPVLDGFEVLRHLRELGEESRPERVILVSGMVDPSLQGSVRELGGDAILSKPFRLDDLRRLLVDELDPL